MTNRSVIVLARLIEVDLDAERAKVAPVDGGDESMTIPVDSIEAFTFGRSYSDENAILRARVAQLERMRDELQDCNARMLKLAREAESTIEWMRHDIKYARVRDGSELYGDAVHEKIKNLIRSNSSPTVATDGYHARGGKQAGYIVYEREGLPQIVFGVLELIGALGEQKIHKLMRDLAKVCFDGADIDGGTLQRWLADAGVLIPLNAIDPCGENCACAGNVDFPTTCYRLREDFQEKDEKNGR